MKTYKIFILGVVTGIIIATVGFHGVLSILDKGVDYVRARSSELAK